MAESPTKLPIGAGKFCSGCGQRRDDFNLGVQCLSCGSAWNPVTTLEDVAQEGKTSLDTIFRANILLSRKEAGHQVITRALELSFTHLSPIKRAKVLRTLHQENLMRELRRKTQ